MKIYGKSPENPPGKDNIRKKSNELIVMRLPLVWYDYAWSLSISVYKIRESKLIAVKIGF
jgi:hypothetical protein